MNGALPLPHSVGAPSNTKRRGGISRRTLGSLLAGLMLGAALGRIGFANWDEVHGMFTFQSLRLTLAFCTAVVLLAIAWAALGRARGRNASPRRIHRGTIVGGLVFGVGWAISGACPAIALVQLGEGQFGAFWTLGGILAGNWLYSVVHDRFFRWTTSSCADV